MSSDKITSTPPARNREATCNIILDATSHIIAEQGVSGFTMSDVAELAHVNRSLIYHYYQDRNNLISETTRFVVKRYAKVFFGCGDDEIERRIALHIKYPEIGPFFFHLMLAHKPFPNLSRRMANAIEENEGLKAANLATAAFDPAFAAITGWLYQLAWSCSRQEVANLLGVSVEEADGRFIANACKTNAPPSTRGPD